MLCSLVSGLLFGFAIIVMPGIAKLNDKEYLLAFKHIDGIIQNNQPLFIIVWAGSIISVIITLIMGIMALSGTEIYLLIFASIMYLFGVQLPTFRFNIPLNNSLQNLEIEALDESQASLSRTDFEIPWVVGIELEPSTLLSLSQYCFYLYFHSPNQHPKHEKTQ